MKFGSFLLACATGTGVAIRQRTAAESSQALLHVLDSMGRLTQGQAMDIARSFLQQAVTPGVEGSLNKALNTAIKEIEAKVDVPIAAAHKATQTAIDAAVRDLTFANQVVQDSKKNADAADGNHYQCMEEEQGGLEIAVAADAEHKTAKADTKAPCQLQQERTDMSSSMNREAFEFQCDNSQDGHCKLAHDKFEERTMVAFNALREEVQQKKKMYTDAKRACEAAHENAAQKHEAHAKAVQDWEAKRTLCATHNNTRATAMCSFGQAMQKKCSVGLPAYQKLVDQAKSEDNEHSHSDRAGEHQSSYVVKCLLKAVTEGAKPDQEALEACEKRVNFADNVGPLLNFHEKTVATLINPKMQTCRDGQEVKFKDTWVVSANPQQPGEYKTAPFAAKMSLGTGTSPFQFCG